MKKIRFFIGVGIFFLMDYAFTTQDHNGLNPITVYKYWDSLGFSGADTAVYRAKQADMLFERGGKP